MTEIIAAALKAVLNPEPDARIPLPLLLAIALACIAAVGHVEGA